MKKKALSFCFLFVFANLINAQIKAKDTEVWEPEPRVVTIQNVSPLSDTIILFDGTNLDEWQAANGEGDANWKIEDNAMIVIPGTGDIKTKRKF